MKFTQDWFSHNIPSLQGLFEREGKRKSILEIGTFEGKSTCWFIQNVLEAEGDIVCIDTFLGGLEHQKMDFSDTREAFTNNTNEALGPTQQLRLLPYKSAFALSVLMHEGMQFDFIYVDGSHTACDVMLDACMAYELLSPGGIMVFDDYLWGMKEHPALTPKMAIDAFHAMYIHKLDLIMIGTQVGYKKFSPSRSEDTEPSSASSPPQPA